MSRNSTIRQKTGQCSMCPPSKGKQPLTKGLCHSHYWLTVRMKSAQKLEEREVQSEDGLPELRDDLDAIFSRYIRMKYADKNGMVACFTCDRKYKVLEMQNGHYMKRANMFLRFDERNCRPQCKFCNENQKTDGEFIKFGKRLEEERPGITEILYEESTLVYKFTRDELRNLIIDYTKKLNQLKTHNQ